MTFSALAARSLRYFWRTNLAVARGIRNLPASVAMPGPANPGRTGFVALAAVVGSIEGVAPFRYAEILPAVMAAASGLAAGALVTSALRRAGWETAVVAVGVGTINLATGEQTAGSSNVVQTSSASARVGSHTEASVAAGERTEIRVARGSANIRTRTGESFDARANERFEIENNGKLARREVMLPVDWSVNANVVCPAVPLCVLTENAACSAVPMLTLAMFDVDDVPAEL